LESLANRELLDGSENGERDASEIGSSSSTVWFDSPNRIACALCSITALLHSLNADSSSFNKHQNAALNCSPSVVSALTHWLARNGPSNLLGVCLSLLSKIVEKNPELGAKIASADLKISPAVSGKTIPHGFNVPSLKFGWKPLPSDDRKCISVLALLVERYVFVPGANGIWNGADAGIDIDKLGIVNYLQPFSRDDAMQAKKGDGEAIAAAVMCDRVLFAQECLFLFERIISVDKSASDVMIQYVLAPPPPPAEDYDDSFGENGKRVELDTAKPLASLLFALLLNGCYKALSAASSPYALSAAAAGGTGVSSLYRSAEVEAAERAANALCVVFVHGTVLAREMASAVTVTHASTVDISAIFASAAVGNTPAMGMSMAGSGGGVSGRGALLPQLLGMVGRAAKMAGGGGGGGANAAVSGTVGSLLVAMLRLLAVVASGCERAAKLVN
jgi:hypothetical protein